MREIKFRAWDKEEKKMYANIIGIRFYPGCIDVTIQDEGGFTDIYDVDLIEYTGLKDKNGKEIYEGDIVTMNPDDDDWNDFIVFWRGRFELKSYTNHPRPVTNCQLADWCQGSDNPCIIIGNIYESKDLLKGANDDCADCDDCADFRLK